MLRSEGIRWADVKDAKIQVYKLGSVVEQAIREELVERESEDVCLIEEESAKPGILYIEDGQDKHVYYCDGWGQYWDEVSNKGLEKSLVEEARLDEIKRPYQYGVYDEVHMDECWQNTGKAPIRVRFLDIYKGKEVNKEYRSRLVAQELKRDNREDLFAETPPLEAKKLLFSLAEGVGCEEGNRQHGMKLDFIDIRKAFFQADARREVYIELPMEDYEQGKCGKLNKCLYGTRDAAQNWMDAYTRAMEEMGFKKGTASPCTFWHARREVRTVVHGDDFATLGFGEQLDWFKG